MRRVSELIGTSVVTSDTGENVGTTVDLLLNRDGSHLIGVVLGRGVLGDEHGVLTFEAVQTLGPDVIVVRPPHPFWDRQQLKARGEHSLRSSTLTHKRVISADGRELGQVKDLCIDERTGELEGYEVIDSVFGALVHQRRIVPRAGDVVVGPDVIIVEASVTGPSEPREKGETS